MFVNIENLIKELGINFSIASEEVKKVNLLWDQGRADQAVRAVEKYLECKNQKCFTNYTGFLNILKKISAEQLKINFLESDESTQNDSDIQCIYIINLFLLAYAEKENDFDKIISVKDMQSLISKIMAMLAKLSKSEKAPLN